MNIDDRSISNKIVICWTVMLILFIANIVLDMIRCQLGSSCSQWVGHIGDKGLEIMTIVLFIYTFFIVLITTVSASWVRYVCIAFAVFITMFYIAHQISHLLVGDKAMGIAHTLDFTHHFIGVISIFYSIKWARNFKKGERNE